MQKKKIISLDEGEDPLSSMSTSTAKKSSTKETFEKSVRDQERDLMSDDFTAENKSPLVINKSIKPSIGHRDDKSLFGGNDVDPKSGKSSVHSKGHGGQQKGAGSSDDSGVSRRPFENSHSLKPNSNEEKMNLARPKSMPAKPEWFKSSNMQLLPGEKLVSSVQCSIMLMQYPHLSTEGTFVMTNFRAQFVPNDVVAFSNRRPKLKEDYLWIPIAFIFKFEKSSDKKNLDVVYVDIYSKDGRIFKLKIQERQSDSISLMQYLHIYAFPERKEQLFAFEYGKVNRELEDKYKGWKIYDIEKEFRRQGVEFESLSEPSGSNQNYTFRLVDNHNFKVCSTYPPKLLIPAKVNDSTFIASSKFRSRERVPAITYYYAKTKTILARSSQSKPGIYTNRCIEDEQLLRYLGNPNLNDIGDTGVNDINLYIYDARPYLNAMATRLNGNGFEDTKWYRNCEIFFMDIDNIHHVRDNHRKLLNLCFSPEISNNKWYSQFESTNWLELISLIIGAALKVTHSLKNGKSCLVHCSDGWDRTSQILSLAQIMVDPYYRTIEGFEVLITKDWVYFGHQFNTRIGHGNKNEKDDQRSPVFLQFLDCVHQLMSQYPFAFEFNQKFLCDIAYHAYSCQFGLFLSNCYQEMLLYKLEEKTVCLWSYLNSQKDRYYNIYYNSKEDSSNPLILRPSIHLKHLRLWEEYFLNYSWLSKPQFELSENVLFNKDFYEHMLLKDRKKIKELKNEVEELKARLRKYEPDGEEEYKDPTVTVQDEDNIKIEESEQEFKGDQPLGDQDNLNPNGEEGGEGADREIEDSYEKIKGSNPDDE